MSTKQRISNPASSDAPGLVGVLAHTPEMADAFFSLYASFWQQGVVDPRTKEMTRIRNARVTDCGF